MELRQLKSFIHLAETLNFSTTAKELFITQSTLSHQILQLEGELGQPLFYRNSHEVTLTEAGQTLLPLAKDTVRSAEHCQLRMDELKNVMSGELRIGVTFSFVSIIAATVKAFLHEHPHVGINVTQSTMAELIEQLTNHELDFVVSYKPIKSNPKVESRVLFQHRLAAIVNEHHALAKRDSITLEELQRYDLAMVAGTDFQYKIKVEMNTVFLLFRMIRESNYVTVLSESTTVHEQGLKTIPIVESDSPENMMLGCIHLLKNAYVKNSSKEFIRILGESTFTRFGNSLNNPR